MITYLFQCLRVICEPRAIFIRAAEQGGPTLLFGLQAFELLLAHPRLLIDAVMRAPAAPSVALMTLVQALVGQVSGPLLFILLVATAYNALARLYGRGADLWAVIGAMSCAWVPHSLCVAGLTTLHRMGVTSSAPDSAGLMLLPSIYGAIALYTLWHHGSIPSHSQALRAPLPAARAGAWAAGLLCGLAAITTSWHVFAQWPQMRPKLAGDILPHFELDAINAEPLDSRQLAGHVTLIDFWATWCGPCMKALPELERLHQNYHAQGLRVVAVNIETNNRAGIQSLIATQHLSLPIYQDTAQLAENMHVQLYPTSFLVDAHGRITDVYSGPAPAQKLEQRIEMLLQSAQSNAARR